MRATTAGLLLGLVLGASPVPAAEDEPPSEASRSKAPWEGAHRDQVTALLGEPTKSKRNRDGSERLTYRLLRLPAGSLPAADQHLVQVPGIGPCVTFGRTGRLESVDIEPTAVDAGGRPIPGGPTRTRSRTITLDKDGKRTDSDEPEGRAGEGKVKLRLYLDENGYVTKWTVSPKPS
jgi:hypothetical protein